MNISTEGTGSSEIDALIDAICQLILFRKGSDVVSRERAALISAIAAVVKDLDIISNRYDALVATNIDLRGRIELAIKQMRHSEECMSRIPLDKPKGFPIRACTCGFNEAISQLGRSPVKAAISAGKQGEGDE